MSGPRVHHQAGGFVHHHDVGILVDHLEDDRRVGHRGSHRLLLGKFHR